MKESSREGRAHPDITNARSTPEGVDVQRRRVIAVAGVLGALAASSCCILPVVLLSFGIAGGWIGGLSALAPYQLLIEAVTAVVLAYGFYLTYGKARRACTAGTACATPLSERVVRVGLWTATVLIVVGLAFEYVAWPLLGN